MLFLRSIFLLLKRSSHLSVISLETYLAASFFFISIYYRFERKNILKSALLPPTLDTCKAECIYLCLRAPCLNCEDLFDRGEDTTDF